MSYRLAQVQQQIHRLLAEVLIKERDNFNIGMVSINDILVSQDLNTVKVWVSFIATADQELAFQKLLRHAPAIQTFLYKHFPVRKVPKIVWQLDSDPDIANRVEKLLDDIKPTSGKDQDTPGSASVC
ncbi:MAG: 30S ribosome-binding factor RbfA [Patescibacteria group bacterium]